MAFDWAKCAAELKAMPADAPRACLVDWEEQDGLVVPWMTFPTMEQAIEARKESHSSWPSLVALIDSNPVRLVLDPHHIDKRKAQAYRAIVAPHRFDVETEKEILK